MNRSQGSLINLLRIPSTLNFTRKFHANVVLLSSEKKKSHKPKTLEQSMEESKQSHNEKKQDSEIYQKSLPKEVANTLSNLGPNVPENWRKMSNLPEWRRQKYALIEKHEGARWDPSKKLSRDQMESVRLLREAVPNINASELAKHFEVTPEAVRRILKSKWKPLTDEEADDNHERWKKRGVRVKKLLREMRVSAMARGEIVPTVLLGSKDEFNQVNYFKDGNAKKERIRDPATRFNSNKPTGAKERLHRFDKASLRKIKF